MNINKKVSELLNCTDDIYHMLRSEQHLGEEIYFLPLGFLLIKWIYDSKERFNWNFSENIEDIFQYRDYDTLQYRFELKRIFNELEYTNPRLKGVFTSLCFKDIDYINPKYLIDIPRIYSKYSEFSFTDSDSEEKITGPFIKIFLKRLNNESNLYGFITPGCIRKLLSYLFIIENNMNIGDITAGTGSILRSVVKRCYEKKSLDVNSINFYAQDINLKTSLISKINLLLSGVKAPNILLNDSLRKSILTDEDNIMPFDIILSNLPLGLDWTVSELQCKNDFKYGFPNKAYADWLFIQRAIAALKKDGKAAFVVSKGTLTRNSEKSIIQNILKEDLIEAIISLPTNLYGSKTMPLEILIINKNKKNIRRDKILFIDASKDYCIKERGKNNLNKDHILKISNTYHEWNDVLEYSKIIDISMLQEYNFELDSTLYVNNINLSIDEEKMKKLKDIAIVKRGFQIPTKDIDKLIDSEYGTHYYIKISDIQDGQIFFNEKIKGLSDSKIVAYELKPNDIIISARGALIKTAIYEPQMPPSIISGNIMLIRTNSGYDSYFLKFYLDSPKGKEFISNLQGGSTIVALNHSKLQELLVPDISEPEQIRLATKMKENEANYRVLLENITKMYQQNIESFHKEIDNFIKM